MAIHFFKFFSMGKWGEWPPMAAGIIPDGGGGHHQRPGGGRERAPHRRHHRGMDGFPASILFFMASRKYAGDVEKVEGAVLEAEK